MGPRRPDGGIGRRTSFRCWRSQGRGGSSPLLGTISKSSDHYQGPEAPQKARASGLFCQHSPEIQSDFVLKQPEDSTPIRFAHAVQHLLEYKTPDYTHIYYGILVNHVVVVANL